MVVQVVMVALQVVSASGGRSGSGSEVLVLIFVVGMVVVVSIFW